MKSWERRLRDLSQLLTNCHSTYFDPDLFRMNTNQFLQTARTVTFIIQKNKAEIPNYQAWYSAAVLTPWGSDDVMSWAKDARNTIEKEGDLELNSQLKATLLFSYLEEQDVSIDCGREELLSADIKKLIRFAQKKLPTGVSDSAAVRFERRWVTASLPTWELLHALCYVYTRMFDCCKSLAQHLGDTLDSSIRNPGSFDTLRVEIRQVQFIKLNGLHTYSVAAKSMTINRPVEPPEWMRAFLRKVSVKQAPPTSLAESLNYYTEMAALTFEHFGNHIPMLFILDDDWRPIDMLSTVFADQADKFIFWRNVAERILSLKASALVWISESWLRTVDRNYNTATRNLPISGERLHILAIDKSGKQKQVGWKILRASETAKPTLQPISDKEIMEEVAKPFFLVPAMRAMGIPDPAFISNSAL